MSRVGVGYGYGRRTNLAGPLARGLALYDIIAVQNPKVRMIIVNKADHFDFRLYPDEYNNHIASFIEFWEHRPAEMAGK